MHAICTLRFNAAIGREAPYYRLKESYRDVRGNVHSHVLLNVGFEPSLTPRQVHRIANFLSDRFANRNTQSLFKERTDSLTGEEARRYVNLDTVEHTDARNVGAEWLCKQTIDR